MYNEAMTINRCPKCSKRTKDMENPGSHIRWCKNCKYNVWGLGYNHLKEEWFQLDWYEKLQREKMGLTHL